jgi:RNA polymerase sigma-70 factor, ECF subfamily
MQRIRANPDNTHRTESVGAVAMNPPDAPRTAGAELEFRDIYAQHFAFVWRCLRSLGVLPSALDDAAQEVFLTVHRRLGDFNGEASFRSWIYGILRNIAANQRRSTRRRAKEAPMVADITSSAPGPLDRVQDREAAEFMEQFLSRLDPKKQEVFTLAVLEQMPIPEVAAALGIPVNTAYTRLRTARLEFQRALIRRGARR